MLLWLSYIVMLSLYALAFGSYGSALPPTAWQPMGKHVLISGIILVITGLNMLSASAIGRAETWVVAVKVAILLLFVTVGIRGIDAGHLAPAAWTQPLHLIAGGMIIFLAPSTRPFCS